MTEWKHLIVLTVELIICAMVVTYGVALNNVGRTANEIQQNESNITDILAEYREFNKYDNTLIWSQDVISSILQYRGQPELHVKYKDGTKTDYTLRTNSGDFSNENLTSRFGVSTKFHAYLEKDANGTIADIKFVECRHPNDSVTSSIHAECR